MDGEQKSQYRWIETSRIAGSLGAEVSGVDLSTEFIVLLPQISLDKLDRRGKS